MPTNALNMLYMVRTNRFTHNDIHSNYNDVRFPDKAVNHSTQPIWRRSIS